MSPPRVSVIVPTRALDDYVRECVDGLARLDYEDVEVLLLPDAGDRFAAPPAPRPGRFTLRVVPTGPVPPGRKRNAGAREATGDVLAFIDSDAYPREDWLRNAVRHLRGEGVGVVGGPGVTPPTDNAVAQAQGAILGSFLVGGSLANRYAEGRPRESDDIHSCNLVAHRRVVEAAGGWDERYWPGEDTLLGLAVRRAGYRQLLAPDVVVFHHRRPTWRGYLRQIWNYAVHRGFFAKRFPETSRRPAFFLPSLFVLGLAAGPVAAALVPPLWAVFYGALALYALLVLAVGFRNVKNLPRVLFGVPMTHLTYGVGFLRGLAARRLVR